MHENFIEYLYAKFLLSDGVSIDTRTLEPDNLFFAIRGPNFDANKFAVQALEKGASYAVVDDPKYVTDDRMILADDGLKALQELAIFHRSRFKRKVLGITGSNGKTTTKELVIKVLQKKYIVHATSGNYNNHIGVPLTLLHILPQTEIAIIEMGANRVGDIAELCSYANPNYGLITNIGHAHTETFGGIEGVLRGKSELFDHLRKTGGIPFINDDDRALSSMKKRFGEKAVYPDADLKLLKAEPFIEFELGGKTYQTQLIGRYNFSNIAAAISVGRQFGVPDESIGEAISAYVPGNLRSQVIKKGSTTIILDAYNANPDSMRVALENLFNMPGRKLAILGDMNEQENPEKQHLELLDYTEELGLEVMLTGPIMKQVAGDRTWFENNQQLANHLKSIDLKDTTILLKASRTLKLEELVDLIN